MSVREKPDPIRFLIAPGIPVRTRMLWMGVLVIAGFLVQLAFSVFFGWLLVLAGALMGMVSGRSTSVDVESADKWETTTTEEIEDIVNLARQADAFNKRTAVYSATSLAGCGTLMLALACVGVSTVAIAVVVDASSGGRAFVPPLRGGLVYPVWILDCLTLLLPIWFGGTVSAWKPPQLERKAEYLLDIYKTASQSPDLEFVPSIQVLGEGEKLVPADCRMLVKLKDGPEDFIGVQVQISINDADGTKYPYCYCVLIARKEFGLASRVQPFLSPPEPRRKLALRRKSSNGLQEAQRHRYKGLIAEVGSEPDVDVVVIRQVTSRGGYYTTKEQAQTVFENAISLARAITQDAGSRSSAA